MWQMHVEAAKYKRGRNEVVDEYNALAKVRDHQHCLYLDLAWAHVRVTQVANARVICLQRLAGVHALADAVPVSTQTKLDIINAGSCEKHYNPMTYEVPDT